MARMIDADRLLRELTALSHGQVWPGWTYDGIRLLIERQPTLTPPNEWVSVEERLPELPDASWCSRSVIVCDNDSNVAPLLWARAQVRGKTVERWRYHWGRIYDGPEITHWMPLPEPPEKEEQK